MVAQINSTWKQRVAEVCSYVLVFGQLSKFQKTRACFSHVEADMTLPYHLGRGMVSPERETKKSFTVSLYIQLPGENTACYTGPQGEVPSWSRGREREGNCGSAPSLRFLWKRMSQAGKVGFELSI